MNNQYKRESRKLKGFYLFMIGLSLLLWAALQASPNVTVYEDGSGIVTMQNEQVGSFCLPLAICQD